MSTKVYGARLKNCEELLKSSSGGIFTALSDVFLNNGDYVLCSVYNYETQILHYEIINSIEERDRARGSKYFASKVGVAFKEAIELLRDNPSRRLLFVGMGCQAEGFRKLSESSRVSERVYIVDIICTGNPSPKVWESYISRINNVSYLTFKDKRNGWYNPTSVALSNGTEVDIQSWLNIFYGHNADKPACAKCPFARTERNVDLTIGDFWRIEKKHPDFYDPNGNSVILIHTDKGQDLFDMIKQNIVIQESNLEACWQSRLYFPPGEPVTRKAFWRAYNKKGIEYALEKFSKMPLWGKILIKIKNGFKKVKKLCSN